VLTASLYDCSSVVYAGGSTQPVHKADVKMLQDEVAALKADFCELQTLVRTSDNSSSSGGEDAAVLQALRSDVDPLQASVNKQTSSYATTVKTGNRKSGTKQPAHKSDKPKVPFLGARKI